MLEKKQERKRHVLSEAVFDDNAVYFELDHKSICCDSKVLKLDLCSRV